MTDVQQVIVQIRAPKGTDPGRVVCGHFTIKDGLLTMTDPNGVPAEDGIGKRYRHKLMPGEDARHVACRLTKKLRLALRGSAAPVNGFDSPISYPKAKYF